MATGERGAGLGASEARRSVPHFHIGDGGADVPLLAGSSVPSPRPRIEVTPASSSSARLAVPQQHGIAGAASSPIVRFHSAPTADEGAAAPRQVANGVPSPPSGATPQSSHTSPTRQRLLWDRSGGETAAQRLAVASHRWLLPARPASEYEEHELLAASNNVADAPEQFWAVVVIASLLSSTLSFLVDQGSAVLGDVRSTLVARGGHSLAINVIANTGVCLAARMLVRRAVEAEGSGIPEVKTMLFSPSAAAKLKLQNYLTLRVLAVKAVALGVVVGAGLPLGKEGPFVHIAACITANLDPGFYKSSQGAVSHLLLASVAVGVGTTFSAPLGGVIFALELMLPQVYDLTAYWGCFTASVCGAVMYATLKSYTVGDAGLPPLMTSDVLPGEGVGLQFPFFLLLLNVLLGAICGLLGGVFNYMQSVTAGSLKKWRTKPPTVLPAPAAVPPHGPQLQGAVSFPLAPRRHVRWDSTLFTQSNWTAEDDLPRRLSTGRFKGLKWIRYLWSWSKSYQWRDLFIVGFVAALNTILTEQLPLIAGKMQPELLSELFSKKMEFSEDWELQSLGPSVTIALCFMTKWFCTILALSLPVPTGIVAPTMILGAFLGRIYVALLPSYLKDTLMVMPGQELTDDQRGAFTARFAIVGAAAFSASVSRAFSMAITVFEVLALPNSVLPLSAASLVAVFVSHTVSPGFFDQVLLNKGLAGVHAINSRKSALPVSRLMRRIDHSDCLPHRASLSDMQRLLDNSVQLFFPVVHHLRGGIDAVLVGTMTREGIQQVLDMRKTWERDVVIDFLEPGQWLQEARSHTPLLNRMPLHVTPMTPVKDVFLLLKVMHEEAVVYVISKGRLLGMITREELLAKTQ